MVPVTIATSMSKEYLHQRLMMAMPHMRKLNATILMVAGADVVLSSLLK